jgi:hypothetical protein
MLRRSCLIGLMAAASASPVFAQNAVQEVVVTGSRIRSGGGEQARPPEIGLRRVADYAVQQVTVSCDTREEVKRRDEMFAMVKGAIELAAKRGGVELATGTLVVEPLTLSNYRNLALSNDGRPDSDQVSFLIKTKLSGDTDAKAALDRIAKFIRDVPTVGRAEMAAADDLELSVVGPDQYRGQIIDLVAADARKTAGQVGADYAVEIRGVDRPVEWTRASLTEVFLYLPYSYSVVPKAR